MRPLLIIGVLVVMVVAALLWVASPDTVQEPVLAGRHYPAEADVLREEVDQILAVAPAATDLPGPVVGVIAPTAEYTYAAPSYANAYGALRHSPRPDRIVILGAAHFATYDGVRVPAHAGYRIPLGTIPIDAEARAAILEHGGGMVYRVPDLYAGMKTAEDLQSPQAVPDEASGYPEFSIEVALPFLMRVYDEPPPIAPLLVGSSTPDTANQLGQILYAALEENDEITGRTLYIAGSNFSHFVPEDVSQFRDSLALSHLLSNNRGALVRGLERQAIYLDGYGPVLALMSLFAQLENAGEIRVLGRNTSVDGGGDPESAVGYAAVVYCVQS